MNRSIILLLGLSAWVLAACGSSSSMDEAHGHDDEHMEEDDDHGHGHEEEMFTELGDWLDMRDAFDPMPQAPANMMVSTGTPGPASWSGEIDGTINPSYPDYDHPEIELVLDDHLDLHGNVYVDTPDTQGMLVHHLDAENFSGPTFASAEDDDNRMTGTFYGADHGTVVGSVNTAIVIGTFQAEKE